MWVVEEGIRACKLGSWDMDHSKVKICQVKEPMYLSAIQCLEFVKIDQVFVVSEDLDGKGEAMKVMLSSFESADNSKEFTVIDVIFTFC